MLERIEPSLERTHALLGADDAVDLDQDRRLGGVCGVVRGVLGGDAFEYEGGKQDWMDAGYPTESG
mgnify:CR=1 FL=1